MLFHWGTQWALVSWKILNLRSPTFGVENVPLKTLEDWILTMFGPGNGFMWFIYTCSSVLPNLHWCNPMTAPAPVKYSWGMGKTKKNGQYQTDGLVQDCSVSIANALEILQSCTKPSKHTSWDILQKQTWAPHSTAPRDQQRCSFKLMLFTHTNTIEWLKYYTGFNGAVAISNINK